MTTVRYSRQKRTRQIGQSGLAAGEGGTADGCALDGSGADCRAQSAVAEESGGHCCLWCFVKEPGVMREKVVVVQWEKEVVSNRGRGADHSFENEGSSNIISDVIRASANGHHAEHLKALLDST